MKLRITDVKKVIGELIAEAWAPHSHERKFRIPTAEEQERIQREFGIKIDFSNCIHDAEYLDIRWNKSAEHDHELFYYVIGLNIKEVHSTLDENYALALASINYEDPFGPPKQYMAMAYGPIELMRQLELSVRASIYETYPNDWGEGTDRTRKWIGQAKLVETMNHIVYNNVFELASRRKLPIDTKFAKNNKERVMVFGLPKDVESVAKWATKDIVKRVLYHFQLAKMDPGIRTDVRGSEYLYYYFEFYNKYTGMWMVRINIFDVTLKWKDLHNPPY